MIDALKIILVEAYTAECYEASIHDGDPGDTGASEVVAVDRVVIDWNTPTINGDGEAQSLTDAVVFAIPDDTEIHSIGLWNSSGEFRDSVVVGLSYPSAGSYAPVLRRRQP